jgi:hypothetical protein
MSEHEHCWHGGYLNYDGYCCRCVGEKQHDQTATWKGDRVMTKPTGYPIIDDILESIAPHTQPAPETGEWHVDDNGDVLDRESLLVARVRDRQRAAQIVSDHAAVPRLEDALIQARNNAQVFTGSQYLDTARQGLEEIVKQIDAALTTLRREG